MFQCYTECINKGYERLGEALYEQSLMFVNSDILIDDEHQIIIKEHQFCKEFNCPPYPSLVETPAKVIDDFMTIEQEINQYKTRNKKNG